MSVKIQAKSARILSTSQALRFLALILIVLLIAGCTTGRPSALVLQPHATPSAQRVVEVLAVTNRSASADGGFSALRAASLSYELYSISIPFGSSSTEIAYAGSRPYPERDFLVVSRKSLSQEQFLAAVRNKANAARSAGVYVHGYNQTYQEALFRLAQVSVDAGTTGPAILFSWPSEASLFGYMADREASLSSRNDLARLIELLTGPGELQQLVVTGHSMGSFLVMETIRQLTLAGQRGILNKLRIMLAAPDIDPDVFLSQLQTIGRQEPPIMVMVSRNDRALAISSQLSGDRPRVGLLDVNDPIVQSAVVSAGIVVLDITSVRSDDVFQHDGFASMAKFAAQLAAAESGEISLPTRAGLFIFDATKKTLTAPAAIVAE